MRTYYNEWDAPTAAWLQELGAGRHLLPGHIDTRSIRDVHPDDVAGYDQCHFFAGIGGWPLALRWAGLENVPGIWTGSPPCQPFSVAGKGLAQSDERHLAPVWLDLIRECKPVLLFGEQVADAIGKGWLDDLFDALEREGYACGAAVLPACSVGAPHIRKRLFFGAVRVEHAHLQRVQPTRNSARASHPGWTKQAVWLADDYKNGCKPRREIQPLRCEHDAEHGGAESRLADTDRSRLEGIRPDVDPQGRHGSDLRSMRLPGDLRDQPRPAPPHNGGWESADWLGCRDGKFRPVEPGTQPLAHGLPARVGRLRGYGNAIVPQVAAAFITEFLGAYAEMQENL
ncbi:DNA cytosine methyltransferase [Gluconobacter sp. Dm-44]|uniref:DNA cytosine methyltransferase n=1 Tax=Gluconobacter sp. Dm-44 TaxID=2799805 RepID=UPI001B8CCC3C|nr:DNA cytosine methyltransferase [Gluconobacter sp. Dm-44]MBS1060747.1 DNA cytosine methyltransferase [Gluconobacter sp. Dm-44]